MPDELQDLWQHDNSEKENREMLMKLIEEKRRGFNDLMRMGNHAEYMLALTLGPLLALLAWKAKFPWTQAGYGLLAATLVILAIATWIDQRQWPRQYDHSLRDHLEALIGGYDRRIRFLRSGKLWVTLPMCGGLVAVFMGIPGFVTSPGAWTFTSLLLASFGVAQWRSYLSARASILQKREEATRLLKELPEADKAL